MQRETCPDAALFDSTQLGLAWLHWACCAAVGPFVVLFNYAYYCVAATVTSTYYRPSNSSSWSACSRCGLVVTSASVFGCSCCCWCCLLCMQSECPVNGSVLHFRSVPAACPLHLRLAGHFALPGLSSGQHSNRSGTSTRHNRSEAVTKPLLYRTPC